MSYEPQNMSIFVTRFCGTRHPIDRKVDSGIVLKILIKELEVPEPITVDGFKDQNATITEFAKICQRNNIQVTRT